MKWIVLAFAVGLALMAQAENDGANVVDIVLHGDITPPRYLTHEMLAFSVPEGIQHVNVTLEYPGFTRGMS